MLSLLRQVVGPEDTEAVDKPNLPGADHLHGTLRANEQDRGYVREDCLVYPCTPERLADSQPDSPLRAVISVYPSDPAGPVHHG